MRASVSELSVRQEEFASLVGANNFSVKKVAEIIGRSYQTAAKYINKWMPIPAECIERLRDYSIIHPPLSRELYKCQIEVTACIDSRRRRTSVRIDCPRICRSADRRRRGSISARLRPCCEKSAKEKNEQCNKLFHYCTSHQTTSDPEVSVCAE